MTTDNPIDSILDKAEESLNHLSDTFQNIPTKIKQTMESLEQDYLLANEHRKAHKEAVKSKDLILNADDKKVKFPRELKQADAKIDKTLAKAELKTPASNPDPYVRDGHIQFSASSVNASQETLKQDVLKAQKHPKPTYKRLLAAKYSSFGPYPEWPKSASPAVKSKLKDFAMNDLKPAADQHEAYPQMVVFEEDTSGVTVQFLGTGGMALSDGDTTILIDPYFTRVPFTSSGFTFNAEEDDKWWKHKIISSDIAAIERGLEYAKIRKADAILCSHGHFDHVLDIGNVKNALKSFGSFPIIYAGPSVLNAVLGQLMDSKEVEKLHSTPFANKAEQERALEQLYKTHNLVKVNCYYNSNTLMSDKYIADKKDQCSDSAEIESDKIFTPRPSIGKFSVKFFRGRHLKIPLTNAVSGSVDLPYSLPAEISKFNEGELLGMYITHTDLKNPVIVLGSTNFLPGQFKSFIDKGYFVKGATLLIGAAGITFGFGSMAGPRGNGDGIGRDDLYKEKITAADIRKVLFNHWDDFAQPLSPTKPVEWLETKLFDNASDNVENFYDIAEHKGLPANWYDDDPKYEKAKKEWGEMSKAERNVHREEYRVDPQFTEATDRWKEWKACDTREKMSSFRGKYGLNENEIPVSPESINDPQLIHKDVRADPEYQKAKRMWEEWKKCDTDEKKSSFCTKHKLPPNSTPTSPEMIRDFKFLPLFKRIKI